jgi:hypothetical protein
MINVTFSEMFSMKSSKSEKIFNNNLGEIWQLKNRYSLLISYYLIMPKSSKLDDRGQAVKAHRL